MLRAIVGLALIGCLAAAGCNAGLGPSESSNDSCTATVTGPAAIAGTYSCASTPITLWVPTTNVTAVNVNITGTPSIAGLFVFSGQPTAGNTYTSANSGGLQSYGVIVTVGNASWEFSAGKQLAPLGSGTLTFTTVTASSSGSSGTLYTAHGALDANLVPSPGTTASGNATLHIVF